MKNLKYILYFFTLALVFSCGEDDVDSVTNEGSVTDSRQITIGFTGVDSDDFLLENGGTATYTFALSEALTSEATVTFAMTSDDGSAEATFSTVVIPQGDTEGTVTVTFTDDGVADAEEFNTFSIWNVEYTSSPTIYLTYDGSVRTATVFDVLPIFIDTTAGNVSIRLDWATGEDLDLYLRTFPGFTSGGANIAFSWFDQPETMTMPGALADGVYYIGVDNFLVTPPFSVACTLSLTFPDAQDVVVLTELTEITWVKITKLTTATGVRYIIVP
ncbi:MAG: hypothetical protein JKY02_08965 [Flavobacteriaceae bacterium]|nr:hypothetical protein [Flavobacteriaceae bacterium]